MFLDLSESSWVKWSPHDHLHSQATLGVDGGHSHWWVQALRSHDGQMTTKHCTQWYTVYKARCSGAEGAKLSLKQTRTWLLGGNIVENQPETDQFDLLCKNEIGKFTWTRHAGWRRSRWRAWGRSSAWRTAGCPRPSVEVDKELI